MNRYKMATTQEKAQSLSWCIKTKSDVLTQRKYRSKYGKDPPSRSSIRRWHKNFMERGSVLDAVSSGWPRISGENIKRVRQAFICTASRELQLLPATVQFYATDYDCALTKCKCYRHFSQITSQNEKSLQLI